MANILKWLDGKKTYLAALAMAIAAFLFGVGKITKEQYEHFITVALPAGLAFLRMSIK